MKDVLVSIIIPMYNAQKSAEACISSIKKLIELNLKIELILIDDGSTDNTGKICDYMADDSDSIHVIHQNNQGVSSARNHGMQRAEGRYLFFLDADDVLNIEQFKQVLLTDLQQEKADWYIYPYQIVYSGKETELQKLYTRGMIKDKDVLLTLAEDVQMNFCWGKFYLNEIIRTNGILFPVDLKVGEDVGFQLEYIQCCEKIFYGDHPLVQYIQNEESVMHQYRINKLDDIEESYYTRKKIAQMLGADMTQEHQDNMYVLLNKILVSYVFRIGRTLSQKKEKAEMIARLEKEYVKDLLMHVNLKGYGLKRIVILLLLKKRMYGILFLLVRMFG